MKVQAEQSIKTLAQSESLAKQLEDAFVRISRTLDQISARAAGAASTSGSAKPNGGTNP
jgi:hypothetical protein